MPRGVSASGPPGCPGVQGARVPGRQGARVPGRQGVRVRGCRSHLQRQGGRPGRSPRARSPPPPPPSPWACPGCWPERPGVREPGALGGTLAAWGQGGRARLLVGEGGLPWGCLGLGALVGRGARLRHLGGLGVGVCLGVGGFVVLMGALGIPHPPPPLPRALTRSQCALMGGGGLPHAGRGRASSPRGRLAHVERAHPRRGPGRGPRCRRGCPAACPLPLPGGPPSGASLAWAPRRPQAGLRGAARSARRGAPLPLARGSPRARGPHRRSDLGRGRGSARPERAISDKPLLHHPRPCERDGPQKTENEPPRGW